MDDIVVGSPIAGRDRMETEGLIGFFVNTLVLRTDLSGDPSFRELLGRVREVALGAYAHQELPFEKLVEELQPDRNLSYNPLFQVVFVMQNAPRKKLELAGLSLTPREVASKTAKFDLTLAMEETDEGLIGWLNYNTDLFETATAERMVGHFQTLLARLVAKPLLRVGDCSLLTPAEEEQLLLKWNQTVKKYPEDLCLHEQIQRQVQEHPDATAISFQGQRLSYSELNSRANKVAHRLQELGVGPEILVAVFMERSFDMVVGLLAILKAGGAYVPLDPAYPPARLALILEEAAIPVLLTQEKLLSQLPSHTLTVLSLDGSDSPLVTDHPQTGLDPLSAVTADNLAYVIYTSGSTGKPKGAMILHRGLTNYLTWCTEAYRVADGQGAPVHSSISFDLTVTAIFSPLLAGREIHLLPEEAGVEGLSADLLTQNNYSLVKITPAHLELLSRLIPKQEAAGRTRALIIGGENLAADSIAFWQQAAPETVLVNEYGPTETVVGCCVYQVPQGRHQTGSIPIGRPIANTQLYILDRRQQPAPIGVPGELHIGGAGLARGYLKSPELTAEKFIPNPFSKRPGRRLYRTGDLCVYLSDGNIEYLGRIDHQVKIRGFRIELGEIEEVLAQHPSVRECVVLSRQDLPGEARLAAYLVPGQNSALTPGEVREYLKQKLPGYMIPSAFLMLKSLPVTANGKVDRKALPVPAEFQNQVDESFQAPGTLVEKELARIWCDVLNQKQAGVHDNFFDSGGHSLLAIQLLFRIKDAFQVSLPVRALFEAPTISQMAERITEESQAANRHSQRAATPWAFLTPIQPVGSKRPLYLVPGGIGGEVEFLVYARLARHLGLNQPLYGLKARGSDGKQEPHTQVSLMAADYIREIRAFQPESPYMLAGECIGGIVAFEVAWQLRAQGQEVSLLALLDTTCPRQTDYLKYHFDRFMIRSRKGILARTFHHLTQLRRVPSRDGDCNGNAGG
jgi:amino acid adenylation domain-containing protein